MKKKVSVIVPIYNVEKYLKCCVDSIINQTYKNLEIILVDDGSTDNSPKICDEYKNIDDRIVVIHKKNGGVSSARNDGIKKAKGIYISFVDSDDWIDENYISDLYNSSLNNNTDIVCCGYKRVYENKSEIININRFNEIIDNTELVNNILNVQTGFGFCHMKLIKKELIGNVHFSEKLVVGEDALFIIQISNKATASFVNKPLYNYRFNHESVVRKYDPNYPNKYLVSMQEMNEYVDNKYENDETIKNNFYNYVAYHILLIAVNYCFHPKNEKKGIKSLKQILNNELFTISIKKSNYKNMSLSRKVCLFAIKHNLYMLVKFICEFRQLQFRR